MKDNLKFILLAIGIIVIFFIMGRDIIENRAKLRKIQNQIAQEIKEKAWIQEELKTTRIELAKTGRELRDYRNKLGFINKKIFLLRSDNASLIAVKEVLERKIAMLREEKTIMEAKFCSMSDLKKAIREVKLEISKEKTRQQREADRWETASGNRGFLIKDGEYFYKTKANVYVRPANLSLNKR